MIDLYDNLKNDDSGEAVYLSDGVWLYPDGRTRDDKN